MAGAIRATSPSAVCNGAPYKTGAGCTPCANLGRGSVLTGTTAATCVTGGQSPCCNLPVFNFDYNGTVPIAYPLLEFNVATLSVRLAVPPPRSWPAARCRVRVWRRKVGH